MEAHIIEDRESAATGLDIDIKEGLCEILLPTRMPKSSKPWSRYWESDNCWRKLGHYVGGLRGQNTQIPQFSDRD